MGYASIRVSNTLGRSIRRTARVRTRTHGGVGGAKPRGFPLSRSVLFLGAMVRRLARKRTPRRARSERAKPAKSTAARKRSSRARAEARGNDTAFLQPLPLNELARRQGIRPFISYEDFIEDLPTGEFFDEVPEQLAELRAQRRAAMRRR